HILESVQPFIIIGKRLSQESHRVRIAAHKSCEVEVRNQGLDFFAISHDSIYPMTDATTAVGPHGGGQKLNQTRKALYNSYCGSWRACIASFRRDTRPFLADAIVASPLAHAHIHCAERLSIPLHIMSTVPWTPTGEFSHSLAHVEGSDGIDEKTASFLSYALIEESIWNTIIEPINRFRQQILGLQRISAAVGGRLMADYEVPHTYLCSQVLVPRPNDWSSMIDIVGYLFKTQPPVCRPDKELEDFMQSDSPLIYIMLQEDKMQSQGMLARAIQETVVKHGFRVLLSEGCRDICRILSHPNVVLTDSVPDEWIIPRVSVVVHHGSAEHTALALRFGKPSVVIRHSEDQFSRGILIARTGAAAAPLHNSMLSAEAFAGALSFCLQKPVEIATSDIQNQISQENGLDGAIKAFYRWLPPNVQKCSITNEDLAMYLIWNRPTMKISPEAAAVLVEERMIKQTDIVL
ncbi:UDP-Glycosyltransferase/glycogen phosphorylase, partial [Aspergillus ellipticus CBS 707.79]